MTTLYDDIPEGESAPDLSLETYNKMKEDQNMATNTAAKSKRKPTTTKAKPVTANARVRGQLSELERLPQAVFEKLGWDERITIYLYSKKEVTDTQADEAFTPIREAGQQIGNYEVQHIGSMRVDDNGRVFRVVKVEHVISAKAKTT